MNRQILADGPSGHRLAESAATRSFLAIGVDAIRADRAVDALAGRFGAKVVDVTQVLIDAMKVQAAEFGLDWEFVQAADAAPAGTTGRRRARHARQAQPARRRGGDHRGGRRGSRTAPGPCC